MERAKQPMESLERSDLRGLSFRTKEIGCLPKSIDTPDWTLIFQAFVATRFSTSAQLPLHFPDLQPATRHSPRAWHIRSGFPPDAPGEDRTLGHTRTRGVECALGPGVVCLGARQRRHQSRFQIWDVDRLELLGRGQ